MEREKIKIGSYTNKTISVLTDGVFLAPTSGMNPVFDEGSSYVVKNYTLSLKYVRECLFLGSASKQFLAPPLDLSEEAIRGGGG